MSEKKSRGLLLGGVLIIAVLAVVFIVGGNNSFNGEQNMAHANENSIELPSVETDGNVSVEKAIFNRESVRNFSDDSLSIEELSQIVWAGAGFRDVDAVSEATRTYPSAGGIYPVNLYIVVRNVDGLNSGVYEFIPSGHKLQLLKEGDFSDQLSSAALRQGFIADAAVNLVYAADYDAVRSRYGERGAERYIYMDIGHAAENVYLQAEAMGLGTVAVGAFDDDGVGNVLGNENIKGVPVYILPVGRPI